MSSGAGAGAGVGGGAFSPGAGVAVLRSVTAFLSRARRAAAAAPPRPPAAAGDASAAATAGQSALLLRRRARMDRSRNAGKLQPKVIENLKKKTHFNKAEIEGLHQIYRKLVQSSNPGRSGSAIATAVIAKPAPKVEGIDASVLRDVLHNTFDLVTEELVLERTWATWARGDGAVRFEPLVCGLSTLLRGSRAERMRHCFTIYDLNSDGYLTKEEMFTLLKNCLLKQPGDEDPDEGVKDLVELLLRKLDLDKDGKVSFEDYEASVNKEPLLMEALGQCLPANAECVTFLETLQSCS